MNANLLLKQFLPGLVGLVFFAYVAACTTPQQTPTVELTVAAILTATRPMTRMPTSTSVHYATATPQPNFQLTITPSQSADVPPDVKPTQKPLKTNDYDAPNGWWSAKGWGEFRGETYNAELRVTRHDGQMAWTTSQDMNAGLGVPLPTPLQWSQDGRYLYYTNVPLVDGYICSIPVNGSDLWRMDLTDGSVTQLVPEVGLSVSLSPDEKTFAYVSFGQQQDLVLRDLATGEERRTPLPANTQSGGIVWSLDSSVLMLTVAETPCSGNEVHSVIRFDVQTLTQKIVLVDAERGLSTTRWEEQGLVFLSGKQSQQHLDSWDVAWIDPSTDQEFLAFPPEGHSISPDRQWIMVTGDYPYFNDLVVIRSDGSQKWEANVDRSKIFGEEGYLKVLQWSPDGRFLYFTLMPAIDGNCGAWYYNAAAVQRFDLTTGRVTELFGGDLRIMSISPNTKWLAYLENKDLVLYDLTTGLEQRHQLEAYNWGEDVAVGNLVWSPDSQSILMEAELNSCSDGLISLIRFDRLLLTQTTLIQNDARTLRIYGWTDEQRAWVSSDGWTEHYLQLNPLTGELITPTIVPQNLRPN